MELKIKINYPKDDNYINNLAFIRALLIKNTIENLNISYDEKVELQTKILEYLKNT